MKDVNKNNFWIHHNRLIITSKEMFLWLFKLEELSKYTLIAEVIMRYIKLLQYS